MRLLKFGAILLGGLILPPSAFAQTEVAYANEFRPGYVIFFSNGPAHLSSVAGETIQMAAADADRSLGLIRVVGTVGYATVVEDELVRDGVPVRACRGHQTLWWPRATVTANRRAWRSTIEQRSTVKICWNSFRASSPSPVGDILCRPDHRCRSVAPHTFAC
jgi:hypothetical protein